MKRALLVVLVVVVIFTGLPLMGMGTMSTCPDCGPAVVARAVDCLPAAILVVAAGVLLAFAGRLRLRTVSPPMLRFARVLERPPRRA